MHADEVHTDVDLVRRLIAGQFPRWADLPVTRVASTGTVNAIYRLGDALAVRLPRIPAGVDGVHKEQRWLPTLAPHLSLAVPTPIAAGSPAEGYPWPWSVLTWLAGQTAAPGRVDDLPGAAAALAGFVRALQAIDPVDGPPPPRHRAARGAPLIRRDAATRAAIGELHGVLDTARATAAWDAALAAPPWEGPPVWFHGDLYSENLLAVDGRLSAVIDFGGLGVGDPACDLVAAWELLGPGSRDVFGAAVAVDDATWARGRGWALTMGLVALPYYRDRNPPFAALARRLIDAVLADR